RVQPFPLADDAGGSARHPHERPPARADTERAGGPGAVPPHGLRTGRPVRQTPRAAGGRHLAAAPGERLVGSNAKPGKRMWGGRFSQDTDALVSEFNASINVDRELAEHDVRGSIAHATMLAETGIITTEEADTLISGLQDILADITNGTFEWSTALEDVHMNIEHALTKRVGPVGGKLHTARSRNDQVATGFRLWVLEHTDFLIGELERLQTVLVDLAEKHLDVIMPGYTHLQ